MLEGSNCTVDGVVAVVNASNGNDPFFQQCRNNEDRTTTYNFVMSADASEIVKRVRYLPSTRDCTYAKGASCTHDSPCTPCGIDRAEEFGSRWKRCVSCSPQNSGKCNFVPEIGPYCFKSALSREVVPCKTCCTDGTPLFDADGICW
jgi:hypothetical protein